MLDNSLHIDFLKIFKALQKHISTIICQRLILQLVNVPVKDLVFYDIQGIHYCFIKVQQHHHQQQLLPLENICLLQQVHFKFVGQLLMIFENVDVVESEV